MANRNSPTSGRAQQERRASARRGTGIAPATPNTSLPNEDAHMPRGAYAPRSWRFCSAEICWRNCDFSDAQTLVYKSGGRQPAVGTVSSRGWSTAIHRQAVALIKSGGRQPAVRTKRICNGASFSRSEYVRAPRGAYAPRSWLHVRMSLQIRASRQRVRIFSHGWLTPAAPGARSRSTEK
jgi:hypothetical protein